MSINYLTRVHAWPLASSSICATKYIEQQGMVLYKDPEKPGKIDWQVQSTAQSGIDTIPVKPQRSKQEALRAIATSESLPLGITLRKTNKLTSAYAKSLNNTRRTTTRPSSRKLVRKSNKCRNLNHTGKPQYKRDYRMTTIFEDDFIHDTELKVNLHIEKFEKMHKRSHTVDDLTTIFQDMYLKVEPHSGENQEEDDLCNRFSDLCDKLPADETFGYCVSLIESLLASFVLMQKIDSFKEIAALVLLFVKSQMGANTSVVLLAKDILRDILATTDIEPQSGGNFNFMYIWREKIHHPLFSKVSFLLSFMVTVGAIKEKCFSCSGFDFFKLEALNSHMNATDILDGIFSTLIFFLEKGYECFTNMSLSPLWKATDELSNFDSDYCFLQSNIQNVRNGNLKQRTGKTDNEYQNILDQCRERIPQYIKTATNSTMRAIMSQKKVVLDKLHSDFHNYIATAGMRQAPFCFCLYGKSSVGKTSLCNTLMSLLLKHNDFPSTDEYWCTVQADDKFYSTYKTKVTGLILDDMCNTKANLAQVNPTSRIIEIINNTIIYANKAAVEEKGQCFIRPKIVAITTNNTTLDAEYWSVEPVSILRRLHVRIVVEVKQAYATQHKLDSNKVMNFYPDCEERVKDIWNLTMQYLIPIANPNMNGAEQYRWETFVDNDGKKLENVGIHEILPYLLRLSSKHFTEQETLVENYTEFASKITLCKECCQVDKRCTCKKDFVTPHSGVIASYAYRGFVDMCANSLTSWCKTLYTDFIESVFPTPYENTLLNGMNNMTLYLYTQRMIRSPFIWWTYLIPDRIVRTESFTQTYFWFSRNNIRKDVSLGFKFNMLWTNILAINCLGALKIFNVFNVNKNTCYRDTDLLLLYGGILPLTLCYSYGISLRRAHSNALSELATRRDITDIYTTIGKSNVLAANVVKNVALLGVGLASLKFMHAIWVKMRYNVTAKPHGGLNPITDADVRDVNNKKNPWLYKSNPLPEGNSSTTTYTSSNLRNVISKQHVYISFSSKIDGQKYCTNGLFLKSNILIVPKHIWYANLDVSGVPYEKMYFSITRSLVTDTGGHTLNDCIYYKSGVTCDKQDLMFFHVPFGGTWRDLTFAFPKKKPIYDTQVLCTWRDNRGDVLKFSGVYRPKDATYRNVHGDIVPIDGGIVDYSIPTFRGMCISSLISDCPSPSIIGLHIAGSTGTSEGAAITLTCDDILRYLDLVRLVPGFCNAHSNGDFPLVIMGKSIEYTANIDKRSPVQFLDSYTADVYGSCLGGSKYRTSIEPSILVPFLSKHLNITNKWSGPQFNPFGQSWKPWYDTLVHLVEPAKNLDPRLLDLAKKDYVNGLLPKLKLPSVLEHLRPLHLRQVINGKPGVKFIDALNFSTSIGFPLKGAKSKHIVDMDAVDDNGDYCRMFEPSLNVDGEISRCELRYLEGERNHFIFKACLKDEPTLITKSKVRVFEAAPLILQLLLRKYYLPLLKFMSTFPLLSECAVGINCYGPDWQELHDHVTVFGDNRILAGDYSKWDLKLPAHLVLSAFDVLIRIAQLSNNYSQQDIVIMRGLATDIAYPVIAYNGTLLGLFGSNPSGQNLTAHLNSICNSLLLRMGFYSMEKCVPFRSVAAMITYGDDVMGGISPEIENFNHVTYARFLATQGIGFTMPDKESLSTDFMNIYETDFLKRQSVFNKQLQHHVGVLNLDSIHKSLCTYRKDSALNQRQAVIPVIRGALFELMLHGEDVYCRYASAFRSILQDLQIHIIDVDIPYEKLVALWYKTYHLIPDERVLEAKYVNSYRSLQVASEVPVVGSLPDKVILERIVPTIDFL